MIHFETEKEKGKTILRVRGNLMDVLADIGMMIHSIANSLPEEKKEAFQTMLVETLTVPDSPVWKKYSDAASSQEKAEAQDGTD